MAELRAMGDGGCAVDEMAAGGLAIAEQKREGLVSAVMDMARMASMTIYCGSVQAMIAGSVEEDEEVESIWDGISVIALFRGRTN